MSNRPNALTGHHILFPEQEWELRPQAKNIRRTPSMIPRLRRADHDYMHDEVPIVPLVSHNTLFGVERLWRPIGNTILDIDTLCTAIDRASQVPRSHQLERDLAGLAIEALMAEKRVLREIYMEPR